MKKIISIVYPFLIAFYPALALRNYNIIYVDFASIIRTLILAGLMTALIWIINRAFTRDLVRISVLTGLTVILFFSYGHVYIQLQSLVGNGMKHSYLVIAFLIMLLSAAWLVSKYEAAAQAANNFLATVSVVLIVISVTQSLFYEYKSYRTLQTFLREDDTLVSAGSGSHPDIYVFILDAHGRSDILKDQFGYDNSGFIRELTDMGFYVAKCSQSNYASTNLSLTSLFNADYIPSTLSGADRLPSLKESLVIRSLRSFGYTVITFENRASGHFDLQEDIRLSRNSLAFGSVDLRGGINEFEETMISTSAIRFLLDTQIVPGINAGAITKSEDYEHYLQTRFILSELPEVPKLKSPKLVFVHIMVPHAPSIFTPDGGFRYPDDRSKRGYRDNAEFIDKNILTAIHSILLESKQPPVIILMGDHGPPSNKTITPQMRMSNLEAYYVKDDAKASLYESITPVNSFRVIFNHYFDGDYPLLKDTSYYAYKLNQFDGMPTIENTCK